LAKSYTPDVYRYDHGITEGAYHNTLMLSKFQVPFYDISWPTKLYPYSFDCTNFQPIEGFTLDKLSELIPGKLQASFY